MAKVEFGHGLEIEHKGEGEYVLKCKIPSIKISPSPTGEHLKQAKKEVLLAVRGLIDKAIEGEKNKS